MQYFQPHQQVAEIVTINFRTAGVFRKYGLDFCCGGKKPLSEVCLEKNLDMATVLNELESVSYSGPVTGIRFDTWPMDKLTFFIVQQHHTYVREAINRIQPYLNKIVKRHGENEPGLRQIKVHFEELSDEMLKHMNEEEVRVFPLIDQIANYGTAERLDSLLENMEDDHLNAGNLMKEINSLTDRKSVV